MLESAPIVNAINTPPMNSSVKILIASPLPFIDNAPTATPIEDKNNEENTYNRPMPKHFIINLTLIIKEIKHPYLIVVLNARWL